jgi:hypothetical protein
MLLRVRVGVDILCLFSFFSIVNTDAWSMDVYMYVCKSEMWRCQPSRFTSTACRYLARLKGIIDDNIHNVASPTRSG